MLMCQSTVTIMNYLLRMRQNHSYGMVIKAGQSITLDVGFTLKKMCTECQELIFGAFG